MGTAGDLHAQTMAATESMSGGQHFYTYLADIRRCRLRAEPGDAIADIERTSMVIDVTQANKEICVRKAGANVELGFHRSDNVQVLGQRVAGVDEDIPAGFESSVVFGPRSSGQEHRASNRRCGIGRVEAIAVRL